MHTLTIQAVPILESNYAWLLISEALQSAYVVDPGESEPILEALDEHRLSLSGVLITHSHRDHIGGLASLTNQSNVPIYGPKHPKITLTEAPLSEGSTIKLWNQIPIKIQHMPGHLPEHITYLIDTTPDKTLCSGDIIFSAGCGRNFVGEPAELKHSLDRIKQLDDNTIICASHEYTLTNLAFASHLEPNNQAIKKRKQEVEILRARGEPSLPTRVKIEKAINPFLRCDQEDVVVSASAYAGQVLTSELDVFTVLRKWKDIF